MAINKENLVRFDWAIKRLLRHRADHSVLNGFLTSLFGRKITITQILESESNREYEENKSNRVDILAHEEDGSKIVIEVQNETESSYLHRMLFGTSKLISELLKKGLNYDEISKVYSVNIVYFNIDEGEDYVYHGTTNFLGMHTGEPLQLPDYIRGRYQLKEAYEIFPEYYILKANDFNRHAVTPLEQWMHYLSHSTLPDNPTAPGLKEAAEQLREAMLTPQEQIDYFYYLDGLKSISAAIDTAVYRGRTEGRAEGLAEGRAEGLAEGRAEGLAEGLEKGAKEQAWKTAERMHAKGMNFDEIYELTGLSISELQSRFN